MSEMRQFVTVNGRFVGEPPNIDPSYRAFCPKCGRALNPRAEGYGLAYGGGIGHYQYCCNRKCDWFYKMLDADEPQTNQQKGITYLSPSEEKAGSNDDR